MTPHVRLRTRLQLRRPNVLQHPQVDRKPRLHVNHILHQPRQIRPQRRPAQPAEPVRILLCAAEILRAVFLLTSSVSQSICLRKSKKTKDGNKRRGVSAMRHTGWNAPLSVDSIYKNLPVPRPDKQIRKIEAHLARGATLDRGMRSQAGSSTGNRRSSASAVGTSCESSQQVAMELLFDLHVLCLEHANTLLLVAFIN